MSGNKFNLLVDNEINKSKDSDIMLLLSGFDDIWADKPTHEIIKLGNQTVMLAPNVSLYGESIMESTDENFVMRWSQPGSRIKYFGMDTSIGTRNSDIRFIDHAKVDLKLLVGRKKILKLYARCDNEHAVLDMGSQFKVRRFEIVHRMGFGTVIRCWARKLKI